MKKISSKYIIQTIKSYIKDESLIFKLINYSKSLQAKFEKNKTFYQEKFLENCIDFKKYLIDYDLPENKSKLQNILLEYQINENDFNNIALLYFEKYFNDVNNNKYINHNLLDISLNSPYFDIFSKSKIFKNFYFRINISNIKEDDKLEEINDKYPLISFRCNNNNDLKNIKNSKINFNKIQALKISILENNETRLDDYFYILSSFNNNKNKLLYLTLELNEYGVKINSLECINNYKLLEYLSLSNFIFDDFELKLNKLKYLNLNHCKKIMFKENIFLNLKNLTLNYCTFKKYPPSLLKCPNVESCELFSLIDESNDYYLIIDFSYFNKLKEFKGNSRYFILLKNTLLEKAILELDFYGEIKHFKKLMNKLLPINTLKEIEINKMWSYNLDYMSEYENKNNSITKVKLNIINSNKYKSYQFLQDIQDKFSNLTEFIINIINNYKLKNFYLSPISINNKRNCKINDLILYLSNIQEDIHIYCGNYEKLKSVSFSIWKECSILDISFPLFYKLNRIIFKSLVSFHFESDENSLAYCGFDNYYNKDFDILENISYNLDKMPNLKKFYFSFGFFYILNEIAFFMEAVKKVLSLKSIRSIYFSIYEIGEKSLYKHFYTKNELKQLYPDVNFNRFYEINITKIR